jgi:hypothetical protein
MKLKWVPLLLLMGTMCANGAQPDTTNRVIRVGDSIARHWSKDCPLRKYGDGIPMIDWTPRLGCQTMMWNVGDGVLVLEHTMGIGRIDCLTYVIKDDSGKPITKLAVETFDPTSEEMTVKVPNKGLVRTGGPRTDRQSAQP